MSARSAAATANTIDTLLMSSTKVLADVMGMSSTQEGGSPWMKSALLRLIKWVAIREPKKRHSDPRKIHMSSFRWLNPVEV